MADLIPEVLRQNLSWLVAGEIRGAETGAMFETMQASAGTLSTTHSHSIASTIDRLVARVTLGGVLSVEEAMWQIVHNINFVVHMTPRDDIWRGGLRQRLISEVRQLVEAVENNRPGIHLAYRSDPAPLFQPETTMSVRPSVFWRISWDR